MATVRITKGIKQKIMLKATEVANSQRKNLPEAEPKLAKDIVNFIINKYDLPTKGHKDIFKGVDSIHFNDLSYLFENPNEIDDEYDLDITVSPAIKTILPHILATAPDRLYFGSLVDPEFSVEIKQELRVLINMRISIEKQCDDFIHTIKTLLGRCTTLKQFIEAWPQGEQFIPQSALRLHYEQEQKQRKRGIYLDEETLTDLNSILLTSKIV